jgi:hypothetical protein
VFLAASIVAISVTGIPPEADLRLAKIASNPYYAKSQIHLWRKDLYLMEIRDQIGGRPRRMLGSSEVMPKKVTFFGLNVMVLTPKREVRKKQTLGPYQVFFFLFAKCPVDPRLLHQPAQRKYHPDRCNIAHRTP